MPTRIVSLVPSLTELIWKFGRGESLVGRTRFCTEPAGEIERVPAVGGTKNPRVERITALNPDLVVANREENRLEDVESLRAAGLRVIVTDPNGVAEALEMITELGAVLGCERKAAALVGEVEAALAEPMPRARPRVFVAVWQKPLLGLGAESYGHDLIERAGAENVLRHRPRYPELSPDELIKLAPDLILLPDEPYPFGEKDAAEFRRIAEARQIDGKVLWWYGPRLPDAIHTLRTVFSGVG